MSRNSVRHLALSSLSYSSLGGNRVARRLSGGVFVPQFRARLLSQRDWFRRSVLGLGGPGAGQITAVASCQNRRSTEARRRVGAWLDSGLLIAPERGGGAARSGQVLVQHGGRRG